jgi:hypothetical protein
MFIRRIVKHGEGLVEKNLQVLPADGREVRRSVDNILYLSDMGRNSNTSLLQEL